MDELDLIKQKINVVELIQEYIPLKKAGVNFKANCPFHQEKSPSFMVSPERGIWHCFGCDKGGDIFKFVMEKEGVEFKEALEILAQKAGVPLKKARKEKDPKERLFEANEKAQQFFAYMLTSHKLGKRALEYLKGRGLIEKTIEEFGLGYAPNSWESLTGFLKKRGYSVDEMVTSGLCVASKRGCYDRFRGRITFSLKDVRNRILGFSGRVLEGGEPKYLNTPQTPIFDKGKFLLGINLTKNEIRDKKEAIIVEGEMDMLLSYQSGVKNVVASKGTALTDAQIELLKRYTDTISLCFDTDLAGDAAARRGIELADQAGLNIKVINFDEAKDPADLVLKDPKLWEEAVNNATPIYDYYLQSTERRFSSKTAAGKRQIFGELLPIWRKITDPIQKEHYIQKLAALLQIKDDVLKKELSKPAVEVKVETVSVNPVKVQTAAKKTAAKDRRTLLEEYLICLMLHLPPEHTFVPTFPETLFTSEQLKQIYVMLVIYLDNISFKGVDFKIDDFAKSLPAELSDRVDRLYLLQIDDKLSGRAEWQKEADMVVAELKKMLIKTSLEKLSLQIKSAQEFDNIDTLETLNKRFRDLSVKLKNM